MGEAYVDFLIIVIISGLFLLLLKILLTMSQKWQEHMDQRVKDAIAYREKRKQISPDPFREKNGYSWDYVMVFQVYDNEKTITYEQLTYNLKHILTELASGGLQIRLFYSVQADEVYCKIRCPLDRLMKEADRINLKLPLDAEKLRALCFAGRPGKWDPLTIPVAHSDTTMDPYIHMYAKYEYDREDVADLYKVWPNGTVFRGCDRLKLIQSILKARKFEGGCFLDVYKLLKMNCALGYFALHDYVELRTLEEKWLRFFQLPWNQPVDDVKDYFGEKIGLYFLWLGHYTTWLISASFVGLCAWINIAAEGNDPNDAVISPYFAAFMAVWATLFLETWKRKEKYHALKWGTVGFEEEEVTRPQFIGERRRNPVNGQDYLFFPASKKHYRLFQSSTIIMGFIFVVIGVVAAIFIMRLFLSGIESLVVGGVQTAAIIASIANAIQIQVMSTVYGKIAIDLNDFENHRTDTAYEDNLIAKSFVFQFVNSYAALIYIAFFKPFLADVDPCVGSCMVELQTTLGTIFLTRLCVGNITEVGIPWFMQRQREKKESEGSSKPLSEVEKNFIQEEYHVMMGTFNDYTEMSIQYGYATMFVAAFPLAALMSFVSNYIEIRIDAWKLCQQCRRPEPRSAEDIGTWQAILEIVSIAAIVVNSLLVAYTGTYTQNYDWIARAWIFIAMSCGIISLKTFIEAVIPDDPREVVLQLERQEYICGKIIDDIEDEDDADLIKGIRTHFEYVVSITDDDPL